MKCLILAGGRGERLWPLSRKNYPKQFIQIEGNHSIFQDTVARNMPYCDEFIIVTSYEYRFIIQNQMKAFQGISYYCIYEEIPRRTAAPIVLACMGLQPSEYVFVTSSDIFIDSDNTYRDAILKAKDYASEGFISVFGKEEDKFDSRYGYISGLKEDGNVDMFVEKPQDVSVLGDKFYRNLGMIVFKVEDFIHQIRVIMPELFSLYKNVYKGRKYEDGDVIYHKDLLESLEALSVERSVLEKTNKLRAVKSDFSWQELTDIEDLTKMNFRTTGVTIVHDSNNSVAINNTPDRALVVNNLDDVVVVNTEDAVYVGRKGASGFMKSIIHESNDLKAYAERGTLTYRHWGFYSELENGTDHYIRRVTVMPGRTIYSHRHESRTENWTILKGKALVTLDGENSVIETSTNIEIKPGVFHQISNIGDDVLEFIDTAFGSEVRKEDNLPRFVNDIKESDLGVSGDSILKLRPVFKDYLWGGTRLRTEYGFKCDYSKIAEAWLVSAHPEGQSVVVNGRHRGMHFGKYVDTVGKKILGWKCAPLNSFPLLCKLIDACDDLSIQVHPDDDYAMTNENQYGKNEMWYVMDALPGSGLYMGFKRDVTPEEVKAAVLDGTITELLNFYPTKKGDVFFIPAGTVHAIGKGNLICEIQQSSTCTYRLYDFDRKDKFGNKRELHLEKALDVLDYSKYEMQSLEGEENVVCRCKYFETLVYNVDASKEEPLQILGDESKFYSMILTEGEVSVNVGSQTVELKAGEAAFVPATPNVIRICGKGSLVLSRV